MKFGIDLVEKSVGLLRDRRLGLLCNAGALNSALEPSADILKAKFNLTALFAAEHGINGMLKAGEDVEGSRDGHTGLMVYSLYGEKQDTPAEALKNIDTLVYDIPDVGVRYYTYSATLLEAMRACARLGKEVVVLDRPNPLNGIQVEGNILNPAYASIVGVHPVCVRYGLTVGELALLINEELGLGCTLRVIPCEGWNRAMNFPETRFPWIPPSPNIPGYEAALIYPASCLIEGTNVSEGRGTASPFEQFGAPWIDDPYRLAAYLNGQNQAGVKFLPAWFKPTFSKHTDQVCAGVRIAVTDPERFNAAETGAQIVFALRELWGNSFEFITATASDLAGSGHSAARYFIDKLAGGDHFTREGASLEAALDLFRNDSDAFAVKKRKWHLY
jgi:uncharacterized protein YbbC (DUF1343 family)